MLNFGSKVWAQSRDHILIACEHICVTLTHQSSTNRPCKRVFDLLICKETGLNTATHEEATFTPSEFSLCGYALYARTVVAPLDLFNSFYSDVCTHGNVGNRLSDSRIAILWICYIVTRHIRKPSTACFNTIWLPWIYGDIDYNLSIPGIAILRFFHVVTCHRRKPSSSYDLNSVFKPTWNG